LVREHDADQTLLERDAEARRRRGVTFRELAAEYLRWLEDIKGAKPSTLRDHRLLLAEPGTAYRRGVGVPRGVSSEATGTSGSPSVFASPTLQGAGPTGWTRPGARIGVAVIDWARPDRRPGDQPDARNRGQAIA